MHLQSPPAAIVLAGGKSTRMGRSKAELLLGGQTLLERTVRTLLAVARPVVVVTAADNSRSLLPEELRAQSGIELVHDSTPDRGPLEGLAAGLRTLSGRARHTFVCGCDSPLLSAQFVQRMLELLGESDVAAPQSGGKIHPLAAAYQVSIFPTVEARLAADQLSLQGLLKAVRTRFVQPHELTDVDPNLDSLRNVNDPQEWQKLIAELAARQAEQQQQQ